MTKQKRRAPHARAVALTALTRVDKEGAYINLVLDRLLSDTAMSRRDRAFATELAFGTLRWRGRLDWVLSHFVKRPLDAQNPLVRNLLRLTAYQLLFLQNIPPAVVVSEAVKLAKEHPKTFHAASFINAVARKVADAADKLAEPSMDDDPIGALAITTSHPEWMVHRWISQYGVERVRAFLQANNAPAPLAIRVNRLRTTVDDVLAHLQEEGIEAQASSVLPTSIIMDSAPGLGRLSAFRRGLFTAQDEGSQVVGHVVGPQAGHVVWDLCSAPGTKTTHLAELMDDQGEVFASDVHTGRLELVRQGVERLGLTSVSVLEGDARRPPGQPETADRVLVDAPCSGVGVLRRRPDLRWHRKEDDFDELITLQRDIILGAATLVRPGGVLVYSTCSIDAAENRQNVEWFLKERSDFALDPLTPWLPDTLLKKLDAARQTDADNGFLQLWPDLDGTDGFFVSRLIRHSY